MPVPRGSATACVDADGVREAMAAGGFGFPSRHAEGGGGGGGRGMRPVADDATAAAALAACEREAASAPSSAEGGVFVGC